MDLQQFEQTILKLAFETDARITAASVAYYLGIPSREANRMLNDLLKEGVLELDSDAEGNLYYQVPNRGAAGSIKDLEGEINSLSSLEDSDEPIDHLGEEPSDAIEAMEWVEMDPFEDFEAPEVLDRDSMAPQQQDREQNFAFMGASPDDDEAREALSPRAHRPRQGGPDADGSLVTARDSSPRRDRRHEADARMQRRQDRHESGGSLRDNEAFGHAIQRRGERPQFGDRHHDDRSARALDGVTLRSAAPDATVDRCGASAMVVTQSARCEPRPLPDSRPIITSCNDADEGSEHAGAARSSEEHGADTRHMWPQQPSRPDRLTSSQQNSQSTALAITQHSDVPMRTDHLEQPEHQPGMALLLSLILCGTGQIYNGEVSKGIMMMVLCFLLWFVLLGWVVHIWSIVDAVVVAERLNRTPEQNG